MKVSLHKGFVDDASNKQDTTAWCEACIKALKTSLLQKGVEVDITAVPIESGVYLTCPLTRGELRVINGYCNAEVFEVMDATYNQLKLMQNALLIFRATEKPWLKWMDDVNNEFYSLLESKSHEQQAAHEFADLLSGSYVPVWVKWDLGALDMADKTKRTDLDEFLSNKGVLLADVPVIQPLKYDLCEILVKDNRKDEIKRLLAGKTYAEFDEESALVSVCGHRGSLCMVLNSYKNNTRTWVGQKMLVKGRVKQLEEKLKGRIEESGSSEI